MILNEKLSTIVINVKRESISDYVDINKLGYKNSNYTFIEIN